LVPPSPAPAAGRLDVRLRDLSDEHELHLTAEQAVAGALPRYGTWRAAMPASRFNSSPESGRPPPFDPNSIFRRAFAA
jgi:hypothetical protein